MKKVTRTLKDGIRIQQYEWPVKNPKAHLIIVHGYAEYAARYDHFAQHLNENGVSVTSYDQRGYGHSDGLSAYIRRFSDYVDDLEEILSGIQTEAPFFLMGHSMGGQVCVQYALNKSTERFKGMIITSALLEIDKDLSPILQLLAPILGAIFPKLPTEKLDKTYLTRSPEVLEAYMNDPLIYLKGTRARTGAEMLKAIKESRKRFGEISIPILVAHGDADRLTMPGGSKKLYEDAASNDKTLKIYPGLYHELLNEPERQQIMEDFTNWIVTRST